MFCKNKPLEQAAPLILENCWLTNDQTMRFEKETRGQHSNSVWQEQRKGWVTAPSFHLVFTKAETILKGRGKGLQKPQYTKLVSSIINKGEDASHLPHIVGIGDYGTKKIRLNLSWLRQPLSIRVAEAGWKNVVCLTIPTLLPLQMKFLRPSVLVYQHWRQRAYTLS